MSPGDEAIKKVLDDLGDIFAKVSSRTGGTSWPPMLARIAELWAQNAMLRAECGAAKVGCQ
jgi:hypothetical protein